MYTMNNDVPVETLFRHKCRECKKMKKRVVKLEMTVERLRNNISLILHDPEVKKQIAVEERVRLYKNELVCAQKKLHEARRTNEMLIEKLVKYEQSISSTD